jgi:hypothetical protein
MVRHYIPKGVRNGQARSGRFTAGNRLAKGRPVGAGNKFPEPPKEMDPRLARTRRFRALLAGVVVDLGGEEMMSTGEALLAQRCAWISVQLELLEQREPFDVAAYSMLTGRLTQVLNLLGLRRRPRDVTPTLRDYIEATGGSEPEPVD